MKRILLVLLIFAVAGGLFAQVSFSGEVGSGIAVAIEDDETTVHVWSTDWAEKYYAELWGSISSESGNVGGEFGFYNYSGTPDIDHAYAWLRPIDTLRIYAGWLNPGGFSTPGGVGTGNTVGDITGVHFRLDPISGLSFGAGFAPNGGEFGDANYNFGVNYTLPGTVNAVANLRYNGAGNEGDGQTNVAAGFNILALSSLGLTRLGFDASVVNLSKLDTAGQFIVGPRIAFSAGDLSLGLRARIYVPVVDGQELNVVGNVTGSYPISDTLGFSLGVGYGLKGAVEDTTGEPFEPSSWDSLPFGYGTEDTSFLVVNPSLSFDVFEGTIGVGYSLQTQFGGDSKLKHELYVNFSVGF
jgi:hypothetical protein